MLEFFIGFIAGAAAVQFIPGVWNYGVDLFRRIVDRFTK